MSEVFKSELQIVENYLLLFVLPFCIGAILRAVLRKKKKGFVVTILLGVISAIMCFMTFTDSAATVFGVALRESFAFWSMDALVVFIGSLITEIAMAIVKRKKKNKSVSA